MQKEEIVSGEFEIRVGLNRLLDEQTLGEDELLSLAEERGLDLGINPKPRLNYLVTLMILRKPKPIQYGKGKGGTRLFQSDTIEILEFVQGQSENFALNEIGDIALERREDLMRKAYKELDIKSPLIKLFNDARFDTHMRCLFNYDLIKANVLTLKLGLLCDQLLDVKKEIAALKSFYQNLEKILCEDCRPEVDRYIKGQVEQEKELLDILVKDLETGKILLGKSQV